MMFLTTALQKKIDFPFSESLFSLLDLDIWKWEPQIKKIDRALLNLYRTRDARYTEDVFFTLQSLSDVHIFFKLLFLDWSKRLNEAEKDNPHMKELEDQFKLFTLTMRYPADDRMRSKGEPYH